MNCSVLTMIICITLAAFAQNPTPQTSSSPKTGPAQTQALNHNVPPLPGMEPMMWKMFFMSHAERNGLAAQMQAKGNVTGANDLRMYDQQKLGLTDGEAKILDQVVNSFGASLAELQKKASTAKTPSEFEQIRQEQTELVSSYVAQLKASFSEASFNKLNAYVHERFLHPQKHGPL